MNARAASSSLLSPWVINARISASREVSPAERPGQSPANAHPRLVIAGENDARQVAVWAFTDYASDRVLGVRFARDSFSVFIAASVPRDHGERILRELS